MIRNLKTVITCMTVLKKNREEETSVAMLVVGTENGNVLILEPSAAAVSKKVIQLHFERK
jgi:hypothetical protein